MSTHPKAPEAEEDRNESFVPLICNTRAKANEEGEGQWTSVSLSFRLDKADTRRKVNAINMFLPGAKPTHKEFSDGMNLSVDERQELHRALMRCRGFYEFMTGEPDVARCGVVGGSTGKHATLGSGGALTARTLPVVSFLPPSDEDKNIVDALLEELLPNDRSRFCGYMMNRDLGFGIVTAVSSITPYSSFYSSSSLFFLFPPTSAKG